MERHLHTTCKQLRDMVMALLIVVMATACSGSEDDAPRYATLYDVVEYAGQVENGTLFALFTPDSEEAVMLTSTRPIDMGDMELGQSIMLAYTPADGKAYATGSVHVSGLGTVTNDELLKGEPESLVDWDADPVWVSSVWRAGVKVVMRVGLVYDSQPRIFRLVVDESTMENEYPDAYLVNIRRNDAENYMHRYYVAFDLHALWTYPSCKGLRIHINNSNNPSLRLFTVQKPLAYNAGEEEEIPDGQPSAPND